MSATSYYPLGVVRNSQFLFGSRLCFDGGQVEKGVDVALAVDLMALAFKDRYDVAILISRDADFKHAIELVKFETGKVVELHQVANSKAYDLITACSLYQPISADIIHRCLRT